MLRTPAINKLISDIAEGFKEQFLNVPMLPADTYKVVEAAIKDATVSVATALYRNIDDFNVDSFYAFAGYPGTAPQQWR